MDRAPRFPSLFYKQRLNAAGIFMLGGVLLYLLVPSVSGMLLVLLSLGMLFFAVFSKGERRKIFLCFAAGLSLSLLSTSLCQMNVLRAKEYVGEEGFAEGYVLKTEGESFDLALVSFKGEKCFFKVRCQGTGPKQGEKISVLLKEIETCSKSSRSEGIDLQAKADKEAKVIGKSYFFSFVSSLRQQVLKAFGKGDTGSFLSAVLLGEREGLSEEIKNDFRITASSHILAISGLHIAQFIGFFFCLTRILSLDVRFARILLYPLTLFLFFLGGAGISVFRASVMSLFATTGVLLRRRSDSVTGLVFSAALLVFFDPFTLENLSFILSYASTFALVTCALPLCTYFQERLFSVPKSFGFLRKFFLSVLSSLCISSVIYVFLLPFVLLYFGEVQILSPLYALVLVPLFQPVLILALLLAFLSFLPSLFAFLSPQLLWLLSLYLRLVHILSVGSPSLVSSAGFSLPFAVGTAILMGLFFFKKVPLSRIFHLFLAIFIFLAFLFFFPL